MRVFTCPHCKDPYAPEHPRTAVDAHDMREEGDVMCYVCGRVMLRAPPDEERAHIARIQEAKKR